MGKELLELKKGRRILLLHSYCVEDEEDCTDELPCKDCLELSNMIELTEDVIIKGINLGELEYNKWKEEKG